MNYRALEDLIGILIKKSGYKITDLRVLEDTDYLTSRKNYLLEEIDNIKNKLDNSKYIDKDSKVKDEEEKKYLERTLSNLTNDKNNLELNGFTVIPLKLYFKGSFAKLLIGVAKGKHNYDKRETIKKRDQERELKKYIKKNI